MTKHVPSQATTTGPQDANEKVNAHFHGRGGPMLPGPSVHDSDGDGDDDTTRGGQSDDANPVVRR